MSVTLGEGSTPLLQVPRLSARLGAELWIKWEGANPTGSFKDRGMAVAVSRALERGAPGIVCASTGNTAASAAAYAARAGLPAVVLQPAGAVALGKLSQALALGAKLLDQGLAVLLEMLVGRSGRSRALLSLGDRGIELALAGEAERDRILRSDVRHVPVGALAD